MVTHMKCRLRSFLESHLDAACNHSLPDKETLYLANVVVDNATVNMVMSVNYSIEFTRKLMGYPYVEIVMSVANGPHIPCIDYIGSW